MNQLREKHIIEASSSSDFEIEGITFEIGGKNKKGMQLKHLENGYIVKDDIEYGNNNIIPLWHFGFLY